MSSRNLALFAGLASAAMLLGAFAFQIIGGMAPCHLCILQRWPHGLAFAVGLLAFLMPNRWLYLLGAALVLGGAGVALYHTGVEQQWWLGPTTCTSQSINGLSSEALMSQILNAPLVRCDEIAWSMFGLSMASWNGIASLGIVGIWLAAFRKA
ncbi:MAG: disulfide bond formation protein B [Alphaproteobacteria bacterium]|nr:disulfide bond formation protein B [Alphaproteobacteria bacterium]